MTSFKVIAFDCDGVMFDTDKANRAYYNDLLALFNRPSMTDEQFEYVQMQTVHKSLELLFPSQSDCLKAHEYRKIRGYAPYVQYMEMEPDLVAVLEHVRVSCRTAVATNRSDTMKSVLELHKLTSFFDKVATALDVPNPKPAPDMLFSLLDHFSIKPGEMLYIGDSAVDETAARAAGVWFAAYGNKKLVADYHISRLSEIKAIVKNGQR